MHEYLPICANHGQMIKARGGALCPGPRPRSAACAFPRWARPTSCGASCFIKSFIAEVDAFVTPSRFLLGRFADWGLPREKLVMIENGLEDGAGDAAPRDPPRSPPQPLRLLRPAQPLQGHPRADRRGDRASPPTSGATRPLYVFGGNLEHQPEEFQAAVKELFRLAGRRLRFMGAYKSPDLPNLMREVDWTIVPSTWWENAPVVIQEAFHHGRPIIASDIGGMAEKVRDGIDGLHFHVSNPESLAEAMTRAIREPDLWDRLRAGIRPADHRRQDAARQHAAPLRAPDRAPRGAQPAPPPAATPAAPSPRRDTPAGGSRIFPPHPAARRRREPDPCPAPQTPNTATPSATSPRGRRRRAVGVFVNLLHLALPLYTIQIYDRVISSRQHGHRSSPSPASSPSCSCFQAVLDVLRHRIFTILGARIAARLGRPVFEAAVETTLRDGAAPPPATDARPRRPAHLRRQRCHRRSPSTSR